MVAGKKRKTSCGKRKKKHPTGVGGNVSLEKTGPVKKEPQKKKKKPRVSWGGGVGIFGTAVERGGVGLQRGLYAKNRIRKKSWGEKATKKVKEKFLFLAFGGNAGNENAACERGGESRESEGKSPLAKKEHLGEGLWHEEKRGLPRPGSAPGVHRIIHRGKDKPTLGRAVGPDRNCLLGKKKLEGIERSGRVFFGGKRGHMKTYWLRALLRKKLLWEEEGRHMGGSRGEGRSGRLETQPRESSDKDR